MLIQLGFQKSQTKNNKRIEESALGITDRQKGSSPSLRLYLFLPFFSGAKGKQETTKKNLPDIILFRFSPHPFDSSLLFQMIPWNPAGDTTKYQHDMHHHHPDATFTFTHVMVRCIHWIRSLPLNNARVTGLASLSFFTWFNEITSSVQMRKRNEIFLNMNQEKKSH